MSWCEFLALLGTVEGVAMAVFGVGLSYLVEVWPKFATLDQKPKRYVVMGICVLLPLLALALAWVTGCDAPTGDDVWQAVMNGGVAFGASQFAHARKLE